MSRYPKLVRDRIPEIIENSGKTHISRILAESEYKDALSKKLTEEAEEFFESRDEEELADVLEVLDAIFSAYGFDEKKIVDLKLRKRAERGGFEKKIELINVESI